MLPMCLTLVSYQYIFVPDNRQCKWENHLFEPMIELNNIIARIEQCKPLIKNWEMLEGIDFDYQNVQVDGLFIDKQADSKGEKWVISLMTTMHTITNKDGRDEYSVCWRFRDLWGNLPFFIFKGPDTGGSLQLTHVDYDAFAVIIFRILSSDQSVVFEFSEPDETMVASVQFRRHQTYSELYPYDYPDGEELF